MFGRPKLLADVHRQMATREWWETERRYFKMYGSAILEGELSTGMFAGQEQAVALVQ